MIRDVIRFVFQGCSGEPHGERERLVTGDQPVCCHNCAQNEV